MEINEKYLKKYIQTRFFFKMKQSIYNVWKMENSHTLSLTMMSRMMLGTLLYYRTRSYNWKMEKYLLISRVL